MRKTIQVQIMPNNDKIGTKYQIIKKIGGGGTATVFLDKDINTGIQYAIKTYQEL